MYEVFVHTYIPASNITVRLTLLANMEVTAAANGTDAGTALWLIAAANKDASNASLQGSEER